MTEFKIGDRVMLLHNDGYQPYKAGDLGTVHDVYNDRMVVVIWDIAQGEAFLCYKARLEKVEEEKPDKEQTEKLKFGEEKLRSLSKSVYSFIEKYQKIGSFSYLEIKPELYSEMGIVAESKEDALEIIELAIDTMERDIISFRMENLLLMKENKDGFIVEIKCEFYNPWSGK